MRITINIPDEGVSELTDLLKDLPTNGRAERLRTLATLGVVLYNSFYLGKPFPFSGGGGYPMAPAAPSLTADSQPHPSPAKTAGKNLKALSGIKGKF